MNERIEGDFYVVLKATFEGPRLYISFRDGRLVVEKSAWLHEAYVGSSPIATELRRGAHTAFPGPPKLSYE